MRILFPDVWFFRGEGSPTDRRPVICKLAVCKAISTSVKLKPSVPVGVTARYPGWLSVVFTQKQQAISRDHCLCYINLLERNQNIGGNLCFIRKVYCNPCITRHTFNKNNCVNNSWWTVPVHVIVKDSTHLSAHLPTLRTHNYVVTVNSIL